MAAERRRGEAKGHAHAREDNEWGADVAEMTVAPRLRTTGLPCIASPEIKSSGNTQQHGTETTALLMLADT